MRDEVASKIKTWKAQFPRFNPQLAVVQVGARQDSTTYVRMKAKAAELRDAGKATAQDALREGQNKYDETRVRRRAFMSSTLDLSNTPLHILERS